MSSDFFKNSLRNLIVIALLLQPHALSNAATLCSGTHCVYLPVTNNPVVVKINQVTSGAEGKAAAVFAFGEVINYSNSPVHNVVVQVTFHYFEGSGFDRSLTNTTFLTATLPGQANAFEIKARTNSATLSEAQVLSWDFTPTPPLANLTIVSSRAYTVPIQGPTGFPDFATVVTGTLRNDTTNSLKDVQVYVWNVNKSLSNRQTISQVSSGATVVFSATLFNSILWDGVDPADTIRIVAQGVVSP